MENTTCTTVHLLVHCPHAYCLWQEESFNRESTPIVMIGFWSLFTLYLDGLSSVYYQIIFSLSQVNWLLAFAIIGTGYCILHSLCHLNTNCFNVRAGRLLTVFCSMCHSFETNYQNLLASTSKEWQICFLNLCKFWILKINKSIWKL